MAHDRLEENLNAILAEKAAAGTLKGQEDVITGVLPAQAGHGPRYLLAGDNDRPFLRMNANAYLGMGLRGEIIEAEEAAVRSYGTGPGAVRFISGTYLPHVKLEHRLAAFHGREAAMIFSSAYGTVMGVLPPLITDQTIVLSDALNHNCIINAIRLAGPGDKAVYRHLTTEELEQRLEDAAGRFKRAIIVTDGIFSMRGDHAPLDQIADLARRYDDRFPENVLLVVDDSHGVGAFGATGRGTEEHTGAKASIFSSRRLARRSVSTVVTSSEARQSSTTCVRLRPFTFTPTQSRRAKRQRPYGRLTCSTVKTARHSSSICRA